MSWSTQNTLAIVNFESVDILVPRSSCLESVPLLFVSHLFGHFSIFRVSTEDSLQIEDTLQPKEKWRASLFLTYSYSLFFLLLRLCTLVCCFVLWTFFDFSLPTRTVSGKSQRVSGREFHTPIKSNQTQPHTTNAPEHTTQIAITITHGTFHSILVPTLNSIQSKWAPNSPQPQPTTTRNNTTTANIPNIYSHTQWSYMVWVVVARQRLKSVSTYRNSES